MPRPTHLAPFGKALCQHLLNDGDFEGGVTHRGATKNKSATIRRSVVTRQRAGTISVSHAGSVVTVPVTPAEWLQIELLCWTQVIAAFPGVPQSVIVARAKAHLGLYRN